MSTNPSSSLPPSLQLPSEGDPSLLVSAHTPTQQSLLEGLVGGATLHVEGPRLLWLHRCRQHYFLLRLLSHHGEGEEEEEEGK